jgi:uncharacterized protein (DUF1499 family)
MTPALTAFGITALGMLLGVVALILAAIIAVRSGVSPRMGLALLGVIPAGVLAYAILSARGAPPINDISTDLVYPPVFIHAKTLPPNAGRDMVYPESFKPQVEKAYPNVQSLGLTRQRDDVFAKAMDIARSRDGWEITSSTVTDKKSTIEGTATTRVFGFVDDFIIRITDTDNGVVVDMRSKSRDGRGDLGANARRIREFFTDLQH